MSSSLVEHIKRLRRAQEHRSQPERRYSQRASCFRCATARPTDSEYRTQIEAPARLSRPRASGSSRAPWFQSERVAQGHHGVVGDNNACAEGDADVLDDPRHELGRHADGLLGELSSSRLL